MFVLWDDEALRGWLGRAADHSAADGRRSGWTASSPNAAGPAGYLVERLPPVAGGCTR